MGTGDTDMEYGQKQRKKNEEKNLHQNLQVQNQLSLEEQERLRQEKERQEQRLQPLTGISEKTKQLFSSTKKEQAFEIREEEVHDNLSEKRSTAFLKQLQVNVESDLSEPNHKGFQKVLKKIKSYVDGCLDGAKYKEQSEKLYAATQAIQEYLDHYKGQKSPEEVKSMEQKYQHGIEQVEMYRMFFDTFTNGYLNVPKGQAMDCTGEKSPMVIYRRQRYRDASKESLFPHEPSLTDLKQGGLGNCYMISGLASVVSDDPEYIKQSMHDDGNGHVTVRFFKEGYDKVEELPEEERRIYQATKQKKIGEMTDQELIVKLFTSMSRKLADQPKEWETVWSDEEDEEDDFILIRNWAYTYYTLNLPALDVNSIPAITKLAKDLTKNTKFMDKIVKQMRDAGNRDGATDTDVILLGQKLLAENARDNEIFDAETIARMEQLKEPKGLPMQPIYVTVDKAVVTDRGEDAYSQECLWAQMIEKAYAASGLHDRKAEEPSKENDRKRLNDMLEETKRQLEAQTDPKLSAKEISYELYQRKKRYMNNYRHIYDHIGSGGRSGYFVKIFTGMELEEHNLNALFGRDVDSAASSVRSTAESAYMMHLMKTKSRIENLVSDFMMGLGKGIEQHCKDKGGHLSLTDITDYFKKMELWIPNLDQELQKRNLTKADLKAEIDAISKDMESILEEQMRQGRLKVQYGVMTGKYTQAALDEYEAIEKALKAHHKVNVGAIKFADENKKGLNGEPISGGMAGDHAYTVLGVKEMDGKKFFVLRNPWRTGENGYVKCTKPGEKPTFESRMHRSDSKRQGVFFLELNEFILRVGKVYVNKKTGSAV